MNNSQRFSYQYSYYFSGNILISIAGLISFPIWTRFFSKEEYGILAIINTTISFLVIFSKLGLPHAALRFYSDFKENKMDTDIESYYTTLISGSIIISASVAIIVLLMTEIFFYRSFNEKIISLLPLSAIIIFIMSINSILTEFIRAEQRGIFYNIVQVVSRYGQLVISIIMVYVFQGNLYGFFLGTAISSCLVLAGLLSILVHERKIRIKNISLLFLKKSIEYSSPLILFELSNMLLSMGDRYLIQYYMGSEAVGIYSAGYNLSDMVQSTISSPLRLAVMPIYLSIWNREGDESARQFISNALNYYLMLGIPVILGMSWFGKEMIVLLATSKFLEAYNIMPYIILPLVINGAFTLFGAGLFIQKKTKLLMYLTLSSGLLNILLNIFLIPSFGILGAAYATLISYSVLAFLIAVSSYRYLKIKIQIAPILKYIILSIIVLSLLSKYPVNTNNQILAKFFLAAILYLIFIIFFDGELRNKVISLFKNLRKQAI